MAIEIVSCPMKNGGSFHSYVNVYQRVEKLHQVVFPQNGLGLLFFADVCGLSWKKVTLSLCGVSFINS